MVSSRTLLLTVPATLLLVFGITLLGPACSGTGEPGGGTSVLASNAIVADWARNVAGDNLEVDTLIPQGADPHTFQLSPAGIRAIAGADLIILVGAGLESSFKDTVVENAKGTIVTLSDDLVLAPATGDAEDDEHAHGEFDPHIWMDPDLAIQSVTHIAGALSALHPGEAETFDANAAAYITQIRTMDESVAAQLAALAPAERILVTFHDAYGYFADQYGLTVLGFVVENADEEPSAARVATLIRDIRESGAVAIYREPQFNARVVDQVAAEAGVPVRLLPSDTLSPAYPTYLDLMHAMADAISG